MVLSVWFALVFLGCHGGVCLVNFGLSLWYCLFGPFGCVVGCYSVIRLVDFRLLWGYLFSPIKRF